MLPTGLNGLARLSKNVKAKTPLMVNLSICSSVASAMASGLIVLAVIVTVLILQESASRDSENALDSLSLSVRQKIMETIALELAALVSLVFSDTMRLSKIFQVAR
eukprot:2000221-Prymnesium_polylepis.1